MSAGGQGWRRLMVSGRDRESGEVLSLRLVPADGAPLMPFEPGQFLTFRIPDGTGRVVPRNYSLSSDPADLAHYRVSIRRQEGGFGSRHMHEAAETGATLEAMGPKGSFVLDTASRRSVILLAAGIGVTPLIAMARVLAGQGRRPTWLIHVCRNGDVQPFARELRELASRAANLRFVTGLTRPEAGDLAAGDHDFTGRIDADRLRSILPIGDYEAYLCGPPGFMQSMFDILLDLGLSEERIRYEFFGPARRLVRGGLSTQYATPTVKIEAVTETAGAVASTDTALVTFLKEGRAARWDDAHRSLLDFAEAHGLSPAFSCRNGICNTCLCEIEGNVRYVDEPLETPAPGQALLCCSVPDGPVALNL